MGWKSIAQPALLALGVVAAAYNILMMINSPEGFAAHRQLQMELAEKRTELGQLERQYAELEHHADSLLTDDLDEDLLEERVRVVLGLVRPDEYLVRMEDLDKLVEHHEAAEAVTLAKTKEDEPDERLRYAALPVELLQ